VKKYLIGVDEAGRGPLAGPVSVGVVSVPVTFDWQQLPGVTDSKKLSEAKREEIYRLAVQLKKDSVINFRVSLVAASVIDRIGITVAVRLGIKRGFDYVAAAPKQTIVKLDGLLKAPVEYIDQETITKGDQKEKVIGLASILAKVTRDRYMVRQAVKYPDYELDIHKGYGTKAHRTAISKHGLSKIHRRSYCKKCI
jgi:ribonuclease HII